MSERTERISTLLNRINGGDEEAFGELVPMLYDAMVNLARGHRARWSGDHTMNTTALVHEAYIKLAEGSQPTWQGRNHFLGAVAKSMRHVLIDNARRRTTEKRGGGAHRVEVDENHIPAEMIVELSDEGATRLIELEMAIRTLAAESPREASVVECRFFGGMSIEETAVALGVSTMTVKRDWNMARARLAQLLSA